MKRLFLQALAWFLILTACTGAANLSGKWRLLSYGRIDDPEPARAEAQITFEGRAFSGHSGCNSFSGHYRTIGNRFIVSRLASTLIACVDAGVMEQESSFFDVLNNAAHFQIENTVLTIYHADGQQWLIFQKTP